jgi:hypothetical protein
VSATGRFFLRTGRFKRSFNWVKLPSETEWRGRGMKLMKVDVRPTGDCLVVSWCFMCRIFIAARDGWKIFANWWRNFQRSWNHMNFPHPSPVLISLDQYWWIVCQKGLTLGRKMNVLIQCWFSFDSLSCFQATGANKLDFGSVSWPRRGVFFIFCPPEIVADLRCWTRRPNRWPSPWGIPTPYQWTINGLLWRMRTFGWTIPFGAWGSWGLGWVLFKSWWTGGSPPKKLRCWNQPGGPVAVRGSEVNFR